MSEHDREWIIGCIKHDGFIKTDRFDKANHIILDALEKNIDAEIKRLSRPTDHISRADAIEAVCREICDTSRDKCETMADGNCGIIQRLEALPSADAVNREIHVGIVNELVKRIEELKADSVKVVRCKDCRWYENRYGEVCHNPRYGDGHANYSPPYVDEEYWCKDGERREP